MTYILILIALIMAGASVCACFKPGKKDGVCKYDQEDINK